MSASMNISLIPAKDDISVHLISELLGTGWWKFIADGAAPSGPGSILGSLFQIIDIALLMYVSAIMVYTAVVGGMATAHEGVPLGKRYHSVWAPIRGPATWFLLFPLPWAKGLAMIQVIMLVAVYWGIGVADDVWSGFVTEIPKYSGLLIPYQGSINKQIKFIEDALVTVTMQTEVEKAHPGKYTQGVYWTGGTSSGSYVYGLTPVGNATASGLQYALGTISIKCSSNMSANGMNLPKLAPSSLWSDVTDPIWATIGEATGQITSSEASLVGSAETSPVCEQEEQAMLESLDPLVRGAVGTGTTSGGLIAIAQKISNMNAAKNGQPPSREELDSIVQSYVQNESSVYKTLDQEFTKSHAQGMKTFSTEASNLGWASSAFYWWTLENINQQAQAILQTGKAKVNMPNIDAVSRSVGPYYLPYMKALEGYIYRYNRHLDAQKIQDSQALSASYIGGAPSESGATWAGKRLMQLPNAFTSGDPLSNVASFGTMMKNAGEDALIGAAVVKTAGGVVSSVGGKSGASAAEGVMSKVGGLGTFLVGGIAGAMKAIGDLAFPVGIMLIVEGAILEYVFPAIPGVIMMIAIIGWLFLVVELMVASVLWAAAHVYAEGEGFAPPQAQYGYSAAIGIIARPLLLTVGFIFAFFILDIGGWFLGEALQIFLGGMSGYHVGLIGFIAIMSVIITTLFMFIKTVLKMITHLADRAPQWIGGHSGQGMGEADIATNAVQSAGQGAQKYGMYGGEKLNGAFDGAVGAGAAAVASSQDSQQKQEKAKKADAQHTQLMEALSGGKAAGQGGEGEEGEKKSSKKE